MLSSLRRLTARIHHHHRHYQHMSLFSTKTSSSRRKISQPSSSSAAASKASLENDGRRRLVVNDPLDMIERQWQRTLPDSTGKFRAFYDSETDTITTNPLLMRVPMDDHLVHRGHGVFDTANLYQGRVYGLDMHFDRFFKSAELASIRHSFTKDQLIEAILDTVAVSDKRDGALIRYWMSVGRGSFGINPKLCERAFFRCMVHDYGVPGYKGDGIKEYTVTVPFKPTLLAIMKSNNYMLNALVAMEASKKGGDLGVWTSPDGYVLEGATAALMFVGNDGILRTPSQHNILASTTARRAIELTREHLVGEGKPFNGVEVCDIKVVDAKQSVEMFQVGGGTIKPVVAWDDHPIGDGQVGPLFRAVERVMIDELANPEYTHEVPYDQWERC